MSKPARRTRPASIVLAAASLLALASCGEGSPTGDEQSESGPPVTAEDRALADTKARLVEELTPIDGVSERVVGEGPRAPVLLWDEELPRPPRDVVVFLPGWSAAFSVPEAYGAWVGHLAKRGSTVLFTSYQDARTTPSETGENVLEGVAAGLGALEERPDSLVVAGHTTGGALAFDYAAAAGGAELPPPDAILGLYPARNPTEELIPAVDPTRIAPWTRIAVLSGDGNPVVRGERQAREVLRKPERVPRERRRYVDIDPAAGSLDSDAVTRREIWHPLDRLISRARRDARRGD